MCWCQPTQRVSNRGVGPLCATWSISGALILALALGCYHRPGVSQATTATQQDEESPAVSEHEAFPEILDDDLGQFDDFDTPVDDSELTFLPPLPGFAADDVGLLARDSGQVVELSEFGMDASRPGRRQPTVHLLSPSMWKEAFGETPQEKRIIQLLKERKSVVTETLASDQSGATVHGFRVKLAPVAVEADLELLTTLPRLFELDLRECRHLGSAAFSQLADCVQIRQLDLADTKIGDADLRHVIGMPCLKALNLASTSITDAGLARLPQVELLSDLDLSGTAITNVGLAKIADCSHIRRLDLANTRIDDAGLPHVTRLASLSTLNLASTSITDAGLAHLPKIESLSDLDLSDTRITDAGLAHLPEIKSLTNLDLSGTRITDAGLASLRRLARVENLNLDETEVTLPAIKELRDTLPKADIYATSLELAARKRESDQAKVHPDEKEAADAIRRLDGLIRVLDNGRIWAVDLNATAVQDDDLALMARLPRLNRLELSGTRITDAGLAHLRSLPNLRQLFFYVNMEVSRKGLQDLQEELPSVRIFSRFSQATDIMEALLRQGEEHLLQGTWKRVSSHSNGKRKEKEFDIWYTFAGNRWMVTTSKGGRREAPFQIDPTKDPKWLDILDSVYGVPLPMEFIYAVDDDTLTLCSGLQRPTAFETNSGDRRSLDVYRRIDETQETP